MTARNLVVKHLDHKFSEKAVLQDSCCIVMTFLIHTTIPQLATSSAKILFLPEQFTFCPFCTIHQIQISRFIQPPLVQRYNCIRHFQRSVAKKLLLHSSFCCNGTLKIEICMTSEQGLSQSSDGTPNDVCFLENGKKCVIFPHFLRKSIKSLIKSNKFKGKGFFHRHQHFS